jgi:tetratricopeptide (TPR) repeat protein
MSKSPQQDDMDFEIQLYENVLKDSPEFVEALMALADLYTKKGLVREGLQLDEKLSRLRPDDPMIFYNLACSYSLLNNLYAALNAVKKAIELGYNDFDYLYQDADLANLLADKEFQQYLKDAQKKKRKRAPNTAKE